MSIIKDCENDFNSTVQFDPDSFPAELGVLLNIIDVNGVMWNAYVVSCVVRPKIHKDELTILSVSLTNSKKDHTGSAKNSTPC